MKHTWRNSCWLKQIMLKNISFFAIALAGIVSAPLVADPVDPEITVIETPVQLLKYNRIFSWHVNLHNHTSNQAANIAHDPTMLRHNQLSVLAHAKSVSSEAIESLRHPIDGNLNQFGLVANKVTYKTQAKDIQNGIYILPEVGSIRYERSAKATLIPTDSCYSFQPELDDGSGSLYKSAIDATSAWDIERGQGSAEISIAVLDSGIVQHTDLEDDRMVTGLVQDFVSSPTQSADGDGRDTDPSDPGVSPLGCQTSGYHGTHVTGTLSAHSNNGKGITGINWRSAIIPVRVLGPVDGATGDIIDAVRWISNMPNVRVMNMSLGLASSTCNAAFFQRPNFIEEAFNKNILTAVAAGNSHADAEDFSPANCAKSMSVAAVNDQGSKAYYSNYGPSIDISAPGGELGRSGNNRFGILSTVNANRYEYKQGTSMATPVVAGVASLVYSKNTTLTAGEVHNTLLATATRFPVSVSHGLICDTEICGAGIVNAAKAVVHADSSEPPLLFFPRQIRHVLADSVTSVDILLSKKRSEATKFSVAVSPHSSCTLVTSLYENLEIPAGALSYSLRINQEPECESIRLMLTDIGTGISLPTDNQKESMTLSYINPNELKSTIEFERTHWSYLASRASRNSHTIYLNESGTYYLGIVSDMNTELSYANSTTGEITYDSREEDPFDTHKHDFWTKFTLDRPTTFNFNVSERSNSGNGGVYAVAITRAPSFRSQDATYCSVPLGVERKACTPSSADVGTSNNNGQTEITYDKTSSIHFFSLLTLFLLLIGSSLLSLRRRTRTN